MFELVRVTASRGGRVVLSELSETIPAGTSAIVGPSGSGKSTLLRLLNRLADPDAGRVLFHGRDVRELDVLAHRRRACLVPQVAALLDGSVEENVAYGARLAGRTAEVERALDLAGLSAAFAPRDPARLSVGEQQRVMLARALALEPEVLLLDEPTSALDAATRDSIEATLAELRAQSGVSVVIVTHDEAQAERLAERIIRLAPAREPAR